MQSHTLPRNNPNIGPNGEMLTVWETPEERMSRPKVVRPAEKPIEEYECAYGCGYATSFPNRLRVHMERCTNARLRFVKEEAEDTGVAIKTYLCDTCDKEIASKEELKIHKAIEHGDHPRKL